MSVFLFQVLLTSVVLCVAFFSVALLAECIDNSVWRNRIDSFCLGVSFGLAFSSLILLAFWVISIIWRW